MTQTIFNDDRKMFAMPITIILPRDSFGVVYVLKSHIPL